MKQSSAKSDLAKLFEKAGAPKFAVGGLSDASLLSVAAGGVRPYYTAAEKEWLAARDKEYEEYNQQVAAYNKKLEDYKKEVEAYNESLKPYQSEVDAYNKALEEYKANIYNPYLSEIEKYNVAAAEYNRQLEDYQKQAEAYNKAAEEYYKQNYPGYETEMAAYNKAVEDYNKAAEAYRGSYFMGPDDTVRIYEKSAGKGGWSGNVKDPATEAVYRPGEYYATLGEDGTIIARQNPVNTVDLKRTLIGRGTYRYTDPRTNTVVGEGNIYTAPILNKDYMIYGEKLYEFAKAPGEFTAKAPEYKAYSAPAPTAPGAFSMTKPTEPAAFGGKLPIEPPKFTGVEPTTPTNVPYTQEQVQQYLDTAKARAQKSAAQRSSALSIAANPEQYGLSGFGLSLPFKDGGEVSNEDFIQQMTVGTLPTAQEPSPADVKASQMLRALGELSRGMVGADALEPGSEAYRTGQALANMPGVALVAGAAKGAGKASKVSEVEKILRNTAGEVQAKRVQRAADEIPNLEDQFSAQALLRAFEGRKGAPYRGVVTIDPADFEKYATALQEPLSKHSTQNIEKLQWVLRDKKGFDEVPFLMIEKKGEPLRLPFVVGHEGRHRNRAMAAESMPKTLVEIMPRGELEFGGVIPEGKMTSDQWRELFNQKLKEGSGLVVAERIQKVNPEAIKVMDELYRLKTSDNPDYEKIAKLEEELLAWKRSPDYVQMDPVSIQKFPEVYAKGGPVTRANGSPEEGEVAQPPELKATPQNPLLGFLAKALKTREEATKGLNSPTGTLLNLVLPSSQTVEKWSYGDPLFRMPPSGTGGLIPITTKDKGYVAETIGYAPIGLPAKAAASGAMVGPPLGVIKPKGGAFPMAGSGSRLDDYLGRVEEVAAQENPGSIANTKAVNEFIRNKGRKYLTSVYGAADDPVREAFLEGRLPKLGTDKERFRNYLMNPAREGDPEALKDFEKFYDEATGLQKFLATQSTDWREAASIKEAAARQMLDKMIKEGVPEESITNTSVDILNPERMLKDYSPEWQKNLARQMQNENLGLERPVSPVDETLFRAVREGETFYDIGYPSLDFMDPRNLGKALATLDPDKLQNMSFAEAIIQGTKNTRLQRDWDEVVRKVRDGKKVDKSMFAIGTEKVQPMGDDTWVRLTNGQAAELEGAAMRHSVGGYAKKGSYGHGGLEALLDGRAQVFSLRDKQGMPRVTIEALKQGDGDLMVTQIRGKFNGLPSDTDQQMIAEFLKGMPVKSVKTDRYHKDILDNELPEPVSIDWQEMLGPKE